MTSEEKLESCKHAIWKAMEGFSEVEASHRVCEITGKVLGRPYIVKNGINAEITTAHMTMMYQKKQALLIKYRKMVNVSILNKKAS